jgi:hypothetical protein
MIGKDSARNAGGGIFRLVMPAQARHLLLHLGAVDTQCPPHIAVDAGSPALAFGGQ